MCDRKGEKKEENDFCPRECHIIADILSPLSSQSGSTPEMMTNKSEQLNGEL